MGSSESVVEHPDPLEALDGYMSSVSTESGESMFGTDVTPRRSNRLSDVRRDFNRVEAIQEESGDGDGSSTSENEFMGTTVIVDCE